MRILGLVEKWKKEEEEEGKHVAEIGIENRYRRTIKRSWIVACSCSWLKKRNRDIVGGFVRKHDEYKRVIRGTTRQGNFIPRPYHKFFLLSECRVLSPPFEELFRVTYKYKNKERKEVEIILEEE